jgi:molecular chaperone DnaK (HSP70)
MSRSALTIIDQAKKAARTTVDSDDTATNNIDSDLVISIDFGTTFTGVAYSIVSGLSSRTTRLSQTEIEVIMDKLVVIKNWPSVAAQSSDKTPTALAYENGQVVAWGGKVKSTHQIQVRHFKLGLQDDIAKHYGPANPSASSLLGGFLRNSNWRHDKLPNKSAWDFTVDYLTAIGNHVFTQVLPAHFGKNFLDNQKVSYVLTVPAIWSDKAKDLTRRAAVKSGIPESKLILVPEPEAAGLYCATMCNDLDIKQGDRFLICDAGGGTVVMRLSTFRSNFRT